jgi:hypothetical protein
MDNTQHSSQDVVKKVLAHVHKMLQEHKAKGSQDVSKNSAHTVEAGKDPSESAVQPENKEGQEPKKEGEAENKGGEPENKEHEAEESPAQEQKEHKEGESEVNEKDPKKDENKEKKPFPPKKDDKEAEVKKTEGEKVYASKELVKFLNKKHSK